MRAAIVKTVLTLALLGCAAATFRDLHAAYNAEMVDGNRIFALFSQLVLVAVGLGIILVTTFIPVIAEWVGNYFFNPNERIEEAPDARARAARANGEYEAAIEEYKWLWQKHSDPDALCQLTEIYREDLQNPGGAVKFLESALDARWTDENAAVINGLLAEIAWSDQSDADRARRLLGEVIDAMPNSRQAMNAQNQLQRIEREVIAEINRAKLAE